MKLFQRNVIALVIFISEDILRSDNAIWISPDGKKVVYATFNDSKVTNVKWKMFGNGMDASVNPYPREAFMRYPKVKNPDSTIDITVNKVGSLENISELTKRVFYKMQLYADCRMML